MSLSLESFHTNRKHKQFIYTLQRNIITRSTLTKKKDVTFRLTMLTEECDDFGHYLFMNNVLPKPVIFFYREVLYIGHVIFEGGKLSHNMGEFSTL